MSSDDEKKKKQQQQEDLTRQLKESHDRWKDEAEDETDRLLNEAIQYSLEQGKGWAPGEREAYVERILDDNFIPPLFASTQEELADSGLAEAFSSLKGEGATGENPVPLVQECKRKGNDAYKNGLRNEAKNKQYFRDAINHYYEAFAWCEQVTPVGKETKGDKDDAFTEEKLNDMKSTLCSNAAMAHMQLKNWGFTRDECQKALRYNSENVKAWYRLAKAFQHLQQWEGAGDAIESGLGVEPENKDLLKLQKLLAERIRKARKARQVRERKRSERIAKVKAVWKHAKEFKIQLGRVPLVATVSDDIIDDDDDQHAADESKWHFHFPHTGQLPQRLSDNTWSWPCMFVYPSHHQSDFVQHFEESEMLALRMAQLYPELEDGETETLLPWDKENDFYCSNLAVYFEVHDAAVGSSSQSKNRDEIVHPDQVELLRDQASTMRFYEASRALQGDEGEDMANVARALERKHLHKQRKAWKKKHGSLWHLPDPLPIVRVHPAMTLKNILTDKRFVVPNFLVTFLVFPEHHPAHDAYLKEHKCIGILQPKELEQQ